MNASVLKPIHSGIGKRDLGGLQKVEEADDHHQGSILEGRNQNAYRRRDNDFQGLRQDDEAHLQIIVQTQ